MENTRRSDKRYVSICVLEKQTSHINTNMVSITTIKEKREIN